MYSVNFIAHIAYDRVDLAPVAGIHRGQLADKTFDRHAASWEHIARISVRYLDPESQRHLCDLTGLQSAVIGHIYIRPGVVIVRPVRAMAIRYAKVNQLDLHIPPPTIIAG